MLLCFLNICGIFYLLNMEDKEMESIANRLKEAMNIRGLKQADIIEKTGINKGALSSYLSGRYRPKQDNIFLLAYALNVNEAWLMGADVPMERTDPADFSHYYYGVDGLDKEILELYKDLPEEKKRLVLDLLKNLGG